MPATRRAAKSAPRADSTRSRSARARVVKPVAAAAQDVLGKAEAPAAAAPLAVLASNDVSPVTSVIPPAPAQVPQEAKGAKSSLAKGSSMAKPAKPAKAGKATATSKTPAGNGAKAKKPKLVRDSFTIPKPEYGVIEELKLRAAKLGQPAKKSEVLRAGVKALVAMSDDALLAVLAAVPRVKTGRPAKA